MSTFNNYCIQEFSFPKPLISYMMDTVNGNILKKLHKSCKYFYIKMPYVIFDYFATNEYADRRDIIDYSAEIPLHDSFINSSERNLWFMDRLALIDLTNMSKFIAKIVECDLTELFVDSCITIDELKFLTKSGNVKGFALYSSTNYYPKNSILLLEDIVPLVPKATSLNIYRSIVTKNTMEKLLMHEHQVKIKQLRLQEIDQLIETKLFCKFLEKNMDTEAHVYIRFEEENLNTIFAAEIFEIIRFWTPKERIPIVSTAECKYM